MAEPAIVPILPDLPHRIELGCGRWQVEGEAARDLQTIADVPSGPVEHRHDMDPGRQCSGQQGAAVENRIRPLALNRKNALFAGHDEGARSWDRIALPIGTTRMNGIEPAA